MKTLAIIFTIIVSFISCKKDKVANTTCFPDVATVRIITDKQATVHFADNQFYIKEQFTIDTRLLPCNLNDEFKLSGLLVTVSGEVKNTLPNYPCCTDNFVITKITK